MKYVCSSLAMVFSFLSPMVRKRLYCSEQKIKARLEIQSKRIIDRIEKKLINVSSSHFMPLKWALHTVYEAYERKEIEDRLLLPLTNEINALHTNCDRLINFKHENFSWGLTKGVFSSLYIYFLVGGVSDAR